jgi:hypothetical protein
MVDKVSDTFKKKHDKDLAPAGPSGSTDKTGEREKKMEDEGGPPPDPARPQAPVKQSA